MGVKVLITGGTGLIGRHLTSLLLKSGYEVAHLSRSKDAIPGIPVFLWDLKKDFIEEGALDQVDVIVHLAGADVAEKKWTQERKRILKSSRVETAGMLYRYLIKNQHQVKSFISASGIAIYGHDTGGIELMEDRKRLGDDFLSTLTKSWEEAADQFSSSDLRVVKLRTGLVLSPDGGALKKLLTPIKFGVGAALGSGEQYMSWIHIYDHIRFIQYAIENPLISGVYNAVAPHPVTNREFMQSLAKNMKKPFFLPNVPGFGLRLYLGEMASMLLGGNKVSSKKIEASGFLFKYPTLKEALNNLLSTKGKNGNKHSY